MARVEFVGQSAQDQGNIAANPSRLVNCYREPIASSGRAAYAIKSAPGLTAYRSLSDRVAAMDAVEGKIYAARDSGLYQNTASGMTFLGPLADTTNATVSGNNGHVTVTAGGDYAVWDGAAYSNPTPGAFSSFGGHDFISGYTVLSQKNGSKFQWSALADPTSLPGLNFSTADGEDDKLIRPINLNGVLYLFKETSHEIWFVTGEAGANAFLRQTGGVVSVGLKGYGLICKVPGGGFFVGDDGRAHLVSGSVTPVSIPAVEAAIRDHTPSKCLTFEYYGHTFCAITFADRAAWVYDIATGEWHERAEGASLEPWSVACSVKNGGTWYVGRGEEILEVSSATTEGDLPLVREITSRTLEVNRRQFVTDLLEVFPRQGFNVQSLELEVSRDGGLTWTPPKVASIGPVGAYGRRVTWRGLGAARQITARIRASEDASFSMMAEAEVITR